MTRLLYLAETYLFDGQGVIHSIAHDDRGSYLTFDETIFYPQGGGQPADKGSIIVDEKSMPVTFVGFADGDVRHYVSAENASPDLIGRTARLQIDRISRMDNARLHTGGHLVSHILETIERSLVPIKGYHFPAGPYVEFINEGSVDAVRRIEEANSEIEKDIETSHDVSAAISDPESIAELRPYLARFVPKDKPSRIVAIGNYRPLPCGGTHIANLSQLGSLRITKIRNQKGNVKVSYEIGPPNRPPWQ
jgi:Ser-tRNA(Ala) deacylase AlaX